MRFVIEVFLNEKVVSFRSKGSGEARRVSGVRLESGKVLRCQMVVMATGVAPRLHLAKSARLKTNQGVLVNELLQTSDPNVFTAGDAAETNDLIYQDTRVNALWTTGVEQGRIAGYNMAGGKRSYSGSLAANSLPVFGVATASIGCTTSLSREDREIISDTERRYLKLILRGSRLIGAVIVGDTTPAGPLQNLIREQEDVSPFIPLFETGSFSYAALFSQRTQSCRTG